MQLVRFSISRSSLGPTTSTGGALLSVSGHRSVVGSEGWIGNMGEGEWVGKRGLAVFAGHFTIHEGMTIRKCVSYLWIRPAIEPAPFSNNTDHTNILREYYPFHRPMDPHERPHTRH